MNELIHTPTRVRISGTQLLSRRSVVARGVTVRVVRTGSGRIEFYECG